VSPKVLLAPSERRITLMGASGKLTPGLASEMAPSFHLVISPLKILVVGGWGWGWVGLGLRLG